MVLANYPEFVAVKFDIAHAGAVAVPTSSVCPTSAWARSAAPG